MALEGTLRTGCHGRSVPVLGAVFPLHSHISCRYLPLGLGSAQLELS